MQAVTLSGHGGPDVLTATTIATPRPAPGEVLIKIFASGVNGPDISQRQGNYAPPADASPLPGLEVAGTIAALGKNVDQFALGDSVVALCNGGGYAEYVAVPKGQVLPKPENWDWAQAATIPETFFTLQQTLIGRAKLARGSHVLVHGGAGGIGATAIQMCARIGAIPIATVSSDQKAEYAKAMGAAHVINYRTEDFVARTLEITGNMGADIIIDIVGGDYANRNLKAAARGGHILQLAVRQGARAEINLGLVLMKALTISGSTLRPLNALEKAELAHELYRTIWPAIADGTILPPRIRTFALADARKAHEAMEAPDHFGKIVLLTDAGRAAHTQAYD